MDPDRFRELSRDFRAEAVNDLCRAILFDSKCCAYLTSSELLSREASVEVGRAVARLDPNLELQLARHALSCVEEGASEAALQSLAILDGIGAGARINPLLVKIAHLDDRKVRSRATALLVKTCRSPKQIELWLGDPDPRVRGNIPECLTPAEFNRNWLEKVFLNCASDENHRVAGSAVVGLCRIGLDRSAFEQAQAMASSDSPRRRRAAAWVIGSMEPTTSVSKAQFLDALHQLRADPDHTVSWSALKSLVRLSR